MSNPRAIRNLAIALVILALAGASCAGGDDEDPGTALGTPDQVSTTVAETTTTAPPATTTTAAAPTPEEEVLAAYLGYWAAVDEALGGPQAQPDLPALRVFGSGESLDGIIQSAQTLLQRGEAYRVPEDKQYAHQSEVLTINGQDT